LLAGNLQDQLSLAFQILKERPSSPPSVYNVRMDAQRQQALGLALLALLILLFVFLRRWWGGA